MYNQRSRRSSSGKSRDARTKPPRFRGSGRSGGQNRQQNRRSGGNRRKAFSGAYIDPRKFINKATSAEKKELHISKLLFSDLLLNDRLQESVSTRGFLHPTDIQAKTIPHILEGKDVIGLANTGEGKTEASGYSTYTRTCYSNTR